MTITATPSQVTYAGDGASLAFPIPYVFDTAADITVIRTSAAGLPTELSTGFAITGGSGSTGTCTMSVAPAVGETLTILDDPDLTQDADYIANDSFDAESHERALDRGVRISKRLNQRINRSIRVDDGDLSDGDDLITPISSVRAGLFLAFDASGNPFASAGTGGGDAALRTDLAKTVASNDGSRLVGFRRTETGSVARSVSSKLLEWVTPLDFGAAGNGTTDDAVALQNALNSLSTNGGTLYLPPGYTFKSTANLNVPVPASGQGVIVDIQGSGWSHGGILFDGAAVTTGLTYTGSSWSYCGTIRDLKVRCQNSAARAVTWSNVSKPKADRCFFHNCAGAAVKVDTALMIELDSVLVIGCGSATEGSVEIDNCTTFKWDHSYISGGNTTIGGLIIGRTFHSTIIGGAIESCGIPLRVGHRADAAIGCTTGLVLGVDFENPGNGNPYIEIGQGISTVFINAWRFAACNGSPSGTATVPYAVRLYRTLGFDFDTCNWALAGAATAVYELDGTNNLGVTIRAHRHLYGNAQPWVRRNAAQVKAAGPHYDWNSDVMPRGLVGTSTPSLTGASVSILVHATQGGYYGSATMVNAGPTTVTALTGGESGMEITLIASNGNTTLTHSTGTADQFNCTAGANLVMASGRPYRFRHSGTNWVQFA